MGRQPSYSVEQARKAIASNRSWRQAIYSLGLNGDGGGNVAKLKEVAIENGISYDHLTGQKWALGMPPQNKIPIKEILRKGTRHKGSLIKKKLLQEGLIKNKCNECGIEPIWNGKKLTLALDHKNGDRTNNEIGNLRLLCPNCHSQTPTFCRKKKADVAELVYAHDLGSCSSE